MMLALLLYVMLFRSLKLYAKKFCLKRQCTLYQIKICCPKFFLYFRQFDTIQISKLWLQMTSLTSNDLNNP